MSKSINLVSPAALLLALGAKDDELQDAYEILERHKVPDEITELVTVARDALELVRIQRAGGG
jgi:hypothetical protein